MDINDIIRKQKKFDEAHDWNLDDDKASSIVNQINKDLIGLYGEIGEFSNLIKKLNLELGRKIDAEEFENVFHSHRSHLEEELIDSFIYLIRIATHLEMDISEKYLYKLNKNRKRFRKYEDNNK